MRYHKIRGIDMHICTCEQKIAYNAAFSAHIGTNAREIYHASKSALQKSDVVSLAVNEAMRKLENCPEYRKICEQYDIDAIFAALRAGMENYLAGSPVLSTYEQIGKTFPALYLK